MNLTGTAQQRTKHAIRQRHNTPNDTSLSSPLAPPSPDSLPKTNDLAHIRPLFSPYSPPTIPIYIVSSASTQTPYIILILAPMHYLYIM